MKELEQAGARFEADAAKDALKDLIADLSETTIQQVAENLPGIGVIFKIGKSIQSIRDYDMMNKVLSFLHELSDMSKSQRENLINKINEDPIYGQKFGTFLLAAIDRHDFKEKSVYLARACKFYERGDMQKDKLIRVKSMIEQSELIYLEKWVEKTQSLGYRDINFVPNLAIEHFESLGILKKEFDFKKLKPKNKSEVKLQNYEEVLSISITDLGHLLLSILLDETIDYEQKRWWDLP